MEQDLSSAAESGKMQTSESADAACRPGGSAGQISDTGQSGGAEENQDGAKRQSVRGSAQPDSLLPGDYLDKLFNIRRSDYTQYSPGALAFLGDAVYELIIRRLIVESHDRQVWKLHNESSRLVRAATQCDIIRAIKPDLTAEERSAYRRGRNSEPKNTAKNATREEYLEATGFEALLGYLYLMGREKRLLDLVRLGFERTGNEI